MFEPQLSLTCDMANVHSVSVEHYEIKLIGRDTNQVNNKRVHQLTSVNRGTFIFIKFSLHFNAYNYAGKTAIKTVTRNVNISDKCSSQAFYKYETLKRNSKQKTQKKSKEKI